MNPTFHVGGPTDKLTTHKAYLSVYEIILSKLKDTSDAVLEVGVDGGYSLLLWRNYFTNATIFGIDLSPCPDAVKDHPSIHHIQGNAYTPDITKMLGEKTFSLIVDDGSHFPEDQVKFIQCYHPLINKEGLMIIEDIQSPMTPPILAQHVPAGFNHALIDLRTVNNVPDDMLFVIWRSSNTSE